MQMYVTTALQPQQSVVESNPEVRRTSDDENQPSASLSTEKANSSSLQDDF